MCPSSTLAELYAGADFVFDSTMMSGDALRGSIQKVLDNGQTPVLEFVYRDPLEAWRDGVVVRVAKGGHTTPLTTFARSHIRSRENFLSILNEFGDRIRFKIVEHVD